MDKVIQLECECGEYFERPISYKEYNDKYPNIYYKWKLEYCDSCYKKRTDNAFKGIPEILKHLIKQK